MFLPVVVGALGDSNGFADGLDGVSLREQFTNLLLQFVAQKHSPSAFFHGVSKNRQPFAKLFAPVHCERGYNAEKKAFRQYFGSDAIDASLLMMPLTGFLPITDERVRSTIEAIERELMQDGLVLRYRQQEEKAYGLPGREGVFLPCSFFPGRLFASARPGKRSARIIRALRNDLGLLSEEYDPRAKRQLGNFPQAFLHLVLATAARILDGETPPFRS